MPISIFYAWQSDRPGRLNRNLIKRALNDAIDNIKQDITIDDALRDIEADQDTKGVPGTPPVAETILKKIRGADLFLADLTFIDDPITKHGGESRDQPKRTPNPNVMLEYGYALHALGDSQIIGVFNRAFGSERDLPFDIVHKRWPIAYSAFDESDTDAGKKNRRDERRKLTQGLTEALKVALTILGRPADVAAADFAEPFVAAVPNDGVGSFAEEDGTLCIRGSQAGESGRIMLYSCPYLFLRFIPRMATKPILHTEASDIARRFLQPMASMRSRGWSSGRNARGAVVFTSAPEHPAIASEAAELFLTRELWGIDTYHLMRHVEPMFGEQQKPAYVPTGAVEEIFIDALDNFAEVARQHLEIRLPARIVAGLSGVKDYTLAVKQWYGSGFDGHIFDNHIIWEGELNDWNADRYDVLKPLFDRIYDSAGLQRPDVRSTGMRGR